MRVFFGALLFISASLIHGIPFPICFSVSEKKIVSEIPHKDKDFAHIIPGNQSTYIYHDEESYYRDYQRSYFAFTRRKGGWDCLRHYEILANGCLPYFIDLESCPTNTMHLLPKKLILEAMHLKGVYHGRIDHAIFDKKRYYEILEELLDYMHQYLNTKAVAQYLLDAVGYQGSGNILFLGCNDDVDYLKGCLLIGLKELLGERIIEIPRLNHIYTNFTGNTKALYGKGFSYTKIVKDIPVNRNNIENRIKNKEFDLIIYGYVHHGLPYYDLVTQYYDPEQILYVCGEDTHQCNLTYLHNFFLREYY